MVDLLVETMVDVWADYLAENLEPSLVGMSVDSKVGYSVDSMVDYLVVLLVD